MGQLRKPFQGVYNVICFNWHFYVLSLVLLMLLSVLRNYVSRSFCIYIDMVIFLHIWTMIISVIVTHYVYDLSSLYKFTWFSIPDHQEATLLNIHAGFDETSILLRNKYKNSKFIVYDFYDSLKNHEMSIRRARKASISLLGTIQVVTSNLPLGDNSVDCIYMILSAHEIRDKAQQIIFFKELNRILKPCGHLVITEHLRDTANFFAYNIGFLHFQSKGWWLSIFHASKFKVEKQIQITPFITTFVLVKYDSTS